MGKRINLTKTDLFLLGLTVLFLLAVALTWLLMPRTARGDYEIEAEQPTEDAAQLRMVNINTAGVDEHRQPQQKQIGLCQIYPLSHG